MIDLKKASAEYLIFMYSSNKEQIGTLLATQKEIEEEMKRRKPIYVDKYSKGDLAIEVGEELTVSKEGEE